MKKILLFGALALIIIELQAHGACLIENIKNKNACTGAASPVNNSPDISKPSESYNNELKQMYQIPTVSTPNTYRNNFPILNPTTNCMFGTCIPKF